MGSQLIRDLDEALLQAYRDEAKANGRSLQAELQAGLRRGRPRGLTKQELLALSHVLTSSTPMTSDSTPYIRTMRDADDRTAIED